MTPNDPTSDDAPASVTTRAPRQRAALLLRAWPVEAEVLIALGLIAASLMVFGVVADRMLDGEFQSLDERLLLALRTPGDPNDPLGPRWLEEFVRDITALGSTGVLTLLVLCVAGFLALIGRRRTALAVIVWSAAGTLVSHLTKLGFARPRPDLVPHAADVFTPSFPSGHAMLSAVIYLTLGALIASTQSDRRVKSYVLGIAVLLTLLVGWSRVYLGVHWPSDVLAGWALGAGWACLGWLAFRRYGAA